MKKNIKKIPNPVIRVLINFTFFLRKLYSKLMPPEAYLLDLTLENIVIQRCLWIAAELGIADSLKKGPKSISELQKETNRDKDALYRVMRMLSSFGIFTEKEGKIFETNELSRYLESDHKNSMLDLILWPGSESNFGIWGDMMNSVKTGKSYYRNNFDVDYFTWLNDKPEEQISFNNLLIEFSSMSSPHVTAGYKFKDIQTLVDLGGGMGVQLSSILSANPNTKGVLFDLPLVIEMVKNDKVFERKGLADRVEFIQGSFFEAIPAGYDAYFMKSIIHDWSDDQAVEILSNCRKAMRKDSKLLITELILPDENVRHISNASNVLMLVFNEGRERTADEYTRLIKEAGLKLNRIYSTTSPFRILEALPRR